MCQRPISLVRVEDDKGKEGEEVVDKNVVEPIELVEKEKVVDEVMDDESDGSMNEDSTRWGKHVDSLTKMTSSRPIAIEQARDAPFEIKRLNSFLVEFLEDQMIRKKPTEIENAYKDARVGISQVDMMPQFCSRSRHNITGCREKKAASMKEKNNDYAVAFQYGL
ncbi:hypothetical protein Tco_1292307 [Tanacetum coccineum]